MFSASYKKRKSLKDKSDETAFLSADQKYIKLEDAKRIIASKSDLYMAMQRNWYYLPDLQTPWCTRENLELTRKKAIMVLFYPDVKIRPLLMDVTK